MEKDAQAPFLRWRKGAFFACEKNADEENFSAWYDGGIQKQAKGADGCGVTTKNFPPSQTIKQRLEWLLMEPRDFVPDGQDNGMAVALALLDLAKGGNLNAIREVMALVGEEGGSQKEVVIVDDVQT